MIFELEQHNSKNMIEGYKHQNGYQVEIATMGGGSTRACTLIILLVTSTPNSRASVSAA
jgi:hypothetical protein